MKASSLSALLLWWVYVAVSAQGGGNPAMELFNKYGGIAGYIIFNFYIYFGRPSELQQRLQSMQATGQLKSLCRYVPQGASCLKSTSSSDRIETVMIVAHLNTQCCSTDGIVNGNWGQWGPWGSCSVTCGRGSSSRTRQCNNPSPSSGGLDCPGPVSDTQSCVLPSCPAVDGQWGSWVATSSCTAPCGGGTQTRQRICDNPLPSNGGSNCVGISADSVPCNTFSCAEVQSGWGSWGQWSDCSVSCEEGLRVRTRDCSASPTTTCSGSSFETQSCGTQQPCTGWSNWNEWSECNVICGGGTRFRDRVCNGPSVQNCPGSSDDSQRCNTQTCSMRDCGLYKPAPRILNGRDSRPGQYPWVAMLASSGDVQCGCSILDEYHVITAGHCLDDKVDSNNRLNTDTFDVIAGQFKRSIATLEFGAQQIDVTSGIRHEDYDSVYLVNDLAVLRLARPLVFNENVSKVCLPASTDVLPSRCTIAGWGSLSYTGPTPDVLQEVDLDAYNSEQCLRTFQSSTIYNVSSYLTEGVMCAANGTYGGQDSCRGDSGSPLMCLQTDAMGGLYFSQFGIVSSGFGCGNRGQPGYYTYVPYYEAWIQRTINTLSSSAAAPRRG